MRDMSRIGEISHSPCYPGKITEKSRKKYFSTKKFGGLGGQMAIKYGQLRLPGFCMPSLFMRERRVLGLRSRVAAALFFPLIFQWVSLSTWII